VNTASRMESHGLPGAIQLSEVAARRLDGKYRLRPRGVIEIKGKGAMETWLLEGQREAAADAAAGETASAAASATG